MEAGPLLQAWGRPAPPGALRAHRLPGARPANAGLQRLNGVLRVAAPTWTAMAAVAGPQIAPARPPRTDKAFDPRSRLRGHLIDPIRRDAPVLLLRMRVAMAPPSAAGPGTLAGGPP